jgi:radical SAM superfamily enzyme YgiQ (UPF0313 family)
MWRKFMARIHIIYFDINTGYFPGVNHGLASLAAITRQNGHYFSFQHLSKKEPLEKVANQAIKNNPDVIGFSFTTNQRQYVFNYSEAIYEKTKVLQIAGGIHPTIASLDVFKINHIKGVCIGEGEYPLQELLSRLDDKKNIYDIPSFWWRGLNGNIIQNPIHPLNPDLSKLPFPDYSIFDTQSINKASSGWIAMLLIRGCPYNCWYCCNHVLRNIYPRKEHYFRMPSTEYAIALIKHSLGFYKNPAGINFADDLLTFNSDWLEEFANSYSKEISLPYTCNSRIESLSDRVVRALKKSNCKKVYIGIESGNEKIRKELLNRHHLNKDIIEGFQRLKKANISTFSYNIVGFPFETKEQMKETLKINKIVKPDMGIVFYFYPYPGTKLFNICKENNLLLSDEESKNISGYREKPAIKLTHCRKKDCLKMYNKIRLFLISQTVVSSLKLPIFFGKIFYWFTNLNPTFWVNVFTKNSKFKFIIRKYFYKYFFR